MEGYENNEKPLQGNKAIGTGYIFLSALLFSIGGLSIKFISWSPLAINGGRSILSVAVIGAYLMKKKHRLTINRFVLLGALCMCATNTLYVYANKLTTAANTIVLQFTAPVFIILFMWLFFKEKPKKLDVATCFAVFSGILFFFMDGLQKGGMLGNALALLSGVAYAGVFMLNTFPNADPVSSIVLGQFANILIGLPAFMQQQEVTLQNLIWIGVLGVFQLGLAYILFSKGLESTPPVTAALVTGIEPILNPALVMIFYKEAIQPLSAIGGVLVFVSILAYNIIRSRKAAVRIE